MSLGDSISGSSSGGPRRGTYYEPLQNPFPDGAESSMNGTAGSDYYSTQQQQQQQSPRFSSPRSENPYETTPQLPQRSSPRANGHLFRSASGSGHRPTPSLTTALPPVTASKRQVSSPFPSSAPIFPSSSSSSSPSQNSAVQLPALADSPAAWIAYYFVANLSLTLYNKLLMNKFPFPWALTGVHTLCGAVGAQTALQRGYFAQQTLTPSENAVLVAFSSLYTVNIAVSNLSLNLVTVPFHQVVRAMTPLFTIVLAAIFLKKRSSRATYLALIPVVLGVVFATYGDYYFTTWGLVLTLFGTLLAAMKTIATNAILVGRLRLDPLDLLLRMSPLAFVQCVLASWYTGELARVRQYGALELTRGQILGLLVNGMIAFGLNVVSFTANKKTSALTMTVAANVKQVLTIVLAVIIFRLHINGTNLFGITLTLLGGALYAKVELDSKRRAQAAAGAPPPREGRHGALSEKRALTGAGAKS